MRSRSMHLAFHDAWIDGLAAVIHTGIGQNLRLKRLAIHLDNGRMDLRGVSEREVAVLALDVRNLKIRVKDVAAIESDIPKGFRHSRVVYVDEVGNRPVIDGLLRAFDSHFRTLRTDAKFQVFLFGLQLPGCESA